MTVSSGGSFYGIDSTNIIYIAPGLEYSIENKPVGIDDICWRYNTMPDSSNGDLASISSASCKVTASYKTQLQVASILSWLCAAVRSSDHEGVSNSSVSVKGEERDKTSRVSIQLEPLELIKSNGTCWHEIFHHGVIAKDFPIPPRTAGQGLEIPFADMALVCGCLGFVEYKQGLVVDGLNSILIPRKRLIEDDAFQWHFESKIREGSRVAYTSDVLETVDMEPWHVDDEPVLPSHLLAKRCFLSWAEKSNIMVGTEEHFNSTTITDSHAKISRSMKYVRSYGLNLGGSVVGHLTFGGTVTVTPTSMPAFFKPSVSNGIGDILKTESTSGKGNHFVLVYDTDAKIGWYLPQACVVLHMAHHYLSEQKYELINAENRETSLEFVKPDRDNDTGATAAGILSKNLNYRIRRRPSSNLHPTNEAIVLSHGQPVSPSTSTAATYDGVYFEDTVKRLWYLLDTVGSTLKMNKSEYMKCRESTPHGIHAVDFTELLMAKGPEKPISIRYIKVYQPWSHLTNDQSTVICCNNIGQAIVATPGSLCYTWSKVPQKKNYLAMTGQTIHYFLGKLSSGLSTELEWLMKIPLIQRHDQPIVIHTQQLKGKFTASLGKFKGKVLEKISRPNTEGTLSNIELRNAIGPQSCLLFTAEKGEECKQQVLYTGSETESRPVNSTIAPLPPALPPQSNTRPPYQQECTTEDSTLVRNTRAII
jgi:hypothetical protein